MKVESRGALTMEKMLIIENLRKAFGDTVAVDDISFTVPKGEIMGFLGPNGAGKTTVLRMIMGIIPPDVGNITFFFDGQRSDIRKEKIGYLPEEKGLYDDVSVLDNLCYLARLKGRSQRQAKREAETWLKRLDLLDRAQQKLEKLSRGMKQKVQIIAAILHHPDFAVLDEPFAGLDPVNQDFVKELIRGLRDEGMTILFSAHQMNLVEELCDEIFMIHNGQEVLAGNLKEIKKSYNLYNVNLYHQPDADLSFLQDLTEIEIRSRDPEITRAYYKGQENVNQFVSHVLEKIELEGISVEAPPLHDIFINTVQEKGVEYEES